MVARGKRLECEECHKTFCSPGSLAVHRSKIHRTGKRPYKRLAGLTEEEKKRYRLQQQTASYHRCRQDAKKVRFPKQ